MGGARPPTGEVSHVHAGRRTRRIVGSAAGPLGFAHRRAVNRTIAHAEEVVRCVVFFVRILRPTVRG